MGLPKKVINTFLINMRSSKAILICVIITICLFKAHAQVINTDSIDQVLKTLKEDTAKVNLLIKTGKTQMHTLHDKALNYCQQAIALSKKIDYPLGLANAYCLKGSCYLDADETKMATSNFQLADSIYHNYKGRSFTEGLGTVLLNYGVIQHLLGNYLEATQFYIKSAKIFESLNDKTSLLSLYNSLSSLYSYLLQFDKAEFYARQCIKFAEETNDSYYTARGSIQLAATLIQQGKSDEVLSNVLKAKKIAERLNDHFLLSTCYSNLGQYYGYTKKDYALAISNLKKAMEHSKILNDTYEEVVDILNINEFYFRSNQFKEAKISALKGYEISHTSKFVDMEQRSLYDLAHAEVLLGEYSTAFNHLLYSTVLKDSVFKDQSQRQINSLEALYQSEKKEKEINQLQSEKQISELIIKRRNVAIVALFVTLALLTGLSFLFYRNIRNKRIIAEKDLEIERQKNKELEKDRQIIAAHAVLRGEEAERSRLARDLHDGLGGLLSGVKFKLAHLKGNLILDKDSKADFSKAIELLDSSVQELRRVAHNMMPEALIKLGLKDATSDFCSEISNPGIKIDFRFYGETKRIDQKIEISAFRIMQELVNNALKHSEASQIVVQIMQEAERLSISVQDNGKGFDPNIIDSKKSTGLSNIKSRVAAHNGIIDINTETGKGTEIQVEFGI
jgi:two-component system, NarL family, sensor kinase